jgi:hypothetical protein
MGIPIIMQPCTTTLQTRSVYAEQGCNSDSTRQLFSTWDDAITWLNNYDMTTIAWGNYVMGFWNNAYTPTPDSISTSSIGSGTLGISSWQPLTSGWAYEDSDPVGCGDPSCCQPGAIVGGVCLAYNSPCTGCGTTFISRSQVSITVAGGCGTPYMILQEVAGTLLGACTSANGVYQGCTSGTNSCLIIDLPVPSLSDYPPTIVSTNIYRLGLVGASPNDNLTDFAGANGGIITGAPFNSSQVCWPANVDPFTDDQFNEDP